jgi:hypothetical protein
MFATIKSLIPEPRQATQPHRYVGRHRRVEPVPPAAPVSPAPVVTPPAPVVTTPAPVVNKPAETETAAV